ncbi:MucR family transcriptional regulator [Microvirga pudoricolor]|uniref:MucR family transcriptional regulator n=1 Tax=Microvirga pudoricolor TaxID=2778729 RepID=UPI00194FCE1A|nr:MucR family transcriptional regulator [Microvirga pudoricolor]MBM6595175.1 MucR family transcriptional regulator [Microvirga pudoricolor]
MDQSKNSPIDYTKLTTSIVIAYVSNNPVPRAELPNLISAVHDALLGRPAPAPPEVAKQEPAVPIKKSVTADFLICLEDGKPYRTLKRHLGKLGLTPEKYREKWSLPPDYPMVARNYSKHRSELAKDMGLGKPVRLPSQEDSPTEEATPVDTQVLISRTKRRGSTKQELGR